MRFFTWFVTSFFAWFIAWFLAYDYPSVELIQWPISDSLNGFVIEVVHETEHDSMNDSMSDSKDNMNNSIRSSRLQMFFKLGSFEDLVIFTEKHLFGNLFLIIFFVWNYTLYLLFNQGIFDNLIFVGNNKFSKNAIVNEDFLEHKEHVVLIKYIILLFKTKSHYKLLSKSSRPQCSVKKMLLKISLKI